MKSRTTIADVAREAGVSTATVSLALNQDARVKPETVGLVRAAVQQLGYVPAPRGRRAGTRSQAGSARRSNRIALLAAGPSRAALNAPVYIDVLHGVEAALGEAGKVMVLRHLPPGEAGPRELFPQKVDGVLLFGQPSSDRLIRRLRELPCVQMMGAIEPEGFWDHVSYQGRRVGQLAAGYLLARGHRHAAMIAFTHGAHFGERCEAFAADLTAGGGTCLSLLDEHLVDDSGAVLRVRPERLAALVDRLWTASPRPSAVFLAADTLAPSFYGELARRRLVAGGDLAVVSCNNEQSLLAHLQPPLATVDIHAELVGRRAVEQLLWRLDHARAPRATIALEPAVVVPADAVSDRLAPHAPH